MTTHTTEIPAKAPSLVAKELLKSSGFLLARLGLNFKSRALARLDEAGFDPYDYSVLAILAEGARQAQATIAGALALDPSRLVALLDSLEERGLVERVRDPEDRRRHVVSITADGKRELSRLRAMVKELENEFFAPLDAEMREQLHEVLLLLACHHDPHCALKSG
ncbi:MAG TPA: MarR family transcriptional regulator [Gaiellaceae bacterium]|jgi:DNA-binding MarR family transcriptional regulator